MLQFRPFVSDAAGTRPSTPGCRREPAPHEASGVAAYEGAAGLRTGAAAGESPLPWPRAKRSLSGFDWPNATAPTSQTADATTATTSGRSARRFQNLI